MPRTAISLTPKDIEAYRHAALQIKPERQDEVQARRSHAWQIARKAARILRKQFGAQKVMVFGSLVHPALFHRQSDVDLVVWGLVGRDYFRAASVLLDIDPSISIDLVAFEDARPGLQEVVLKEGQEI